MQHDHVFGQKKWMGRDVIKIVLLPDVLYFRINVFEWQTIAYNQPSPPRCSRSEQAEHQPTPLAIADPTHPCAHHKGLHPFVGGFCITASVTAQERLFHSPLGSKNPNSCTPCSHSGAHTRATPAKGQSPRTHQHGLKDLTSISARTQAVVER